MTAQIECDGGPHCQAAEHIHGCFAERSTVQTYYGPSGDWEVGAEIDDTGAVVGYKLHMWFPTPEAAFDAALALRNFMASEGWPCTID